MQTGKGSKLCRICRKQIKNRQHFNTCSICYCYFHRVGCLPSVASTVFWNTKNNWKCADCSRPQAYSLLGPPSQPLFTNTESSSTLTQSPHLSSPSAVLLKNLPFFPSTPRNIILHSIPEPINVNYRVYNTSTAGTKEQGLVSNIQSASALGNTAANETLRIRNVNSNSLLLSKDDLNSGLNSKGFKIAHLNINSLRNKLSELAIAMHKFKITVMVLTESKLNRSDITTRLMIDGYNIARFDNEFGKEHGGGIVLYISHKCAYNHIDLVFAYPKIKFPKNTEVKLTCVKPPHSRRIMLVTIYKPPQVKQLVNFTTALEELLVQIQSDKYDVILTGDMNIDLHGDSNTAFQMLNITKSVGLKQVISQATRVTSSTSKLLDHMYVPNNDNFSVNGVLKVNGLSDHEMIFTIRKNVKLDKLENQIVAARSWNNVDFEVIGKELMAMDWSFIKLNTVDSAIELFNDILLKIVNKYSPLKKFRKRGHSNPWMTNAILLLRSQRDKAHKLLSKVDPLIQPSLHNELTKKYKLIKNKTNNLVQQTEKIYFNTQFKESAHSSRATWNTMNQLTKFRRHNKHKFMNLTNEKGEDCLEIESMASALAEVFLIKNVTTDNISKFEINALSNCNSTQIVFTKENVIYAMKETRPVPIDPNEVPPLFLKGMSMVLAEPIADILNLSLRNQQFPKLWKSSVITPLYKRKGSKLIPGNYRPIANTYFLSKVYERLLKAKITTHLNQNNLLSDCQHGYRSARSCHTALKVLTNFIYENIDEPKGKVPVVFVDFSKAFDCVNHKLLIEKLIFEFDLSSELVHILHDYLKDRQVKIKINDIISSPFKVESGVPQGSILGPLLFTMFVNELDKILDIDKISFILYADDLAIYTYDKDLSKAVAILNVALSKLENWSKSVGLFMNYSKTDFMVFHKNKDTTGIPNINLHCNDKQIGRVYEFKYLGIILDPSLTFASHFKKLESKVSYAVGRVNGLKRKLTKEAFSLLLNAYVLSNIDFCLSVWAVHTGAQYTNMQTKIDNLINSYYNPKWSKRKQSRLFLNSKYKDLLTHVANDTKKLWELCNVHSISERIEFYTLIELHKTMFRDSSLKLMKQWYTLKKCDRSDRYIGTFDVIRHKSQAYKNSFRYRSIELWNSMIMYGGIFSEDYHEFKTNVAIWVMRSRYDEYT